MLIRPNIFLVALEARFFFCFIASLMSSRRRKKEKSLLYKQYRHAARLSWLHFTTSSYSGQKRSFGWADVWIPLYALTLLRLANYNSLYRHGPRVSPNSVSSIASYLLRYSSYCTMLHMYDRLMLLLTAQNDISTFLKSEWSMFLGQHSSHFIDFQN